MHGAIGNGHGVGQVPRPVAPPLDERRLRAVRDELFAHSFLFDRPQDYRAGVEDTLRLLREQSGGDHRRRSPLTGSAV